MDKYSPDQNEQFNDLPLPDVNESWQKMQQLLDKEEDNRKPLVPVFLRSCMGWGLALFMAGASAWYFLRQDERSTREIPATSQSPASLPENDPINNSSTQTKTTIHPSNKIDQSSENEILHTPIATRPVNLSTDQRASESRLVHNSTKKGQLKRKTGTEEYKEQLSFKETTNLKNSEKLPVETETEEIKVNKDGTGRLILDTIHTDPSEIFDNEIHFDSAAFDSLSTKEVVVQEPAVKRKADQKKKWKLSAGLGLQQQISMQGQKAVPYNYYGRKSSLSDYIPSAFIRLDRNKWFLQGEFRYGAPQTLKDFAYSQQSRLDTSHTYLNTTTYFLKKTYYHQFPLSINYFIRPGFSIGLGGIYSRFSGAVMEKEEVNLNTITQQETLSRQMFNQRQFNDSFLYKTQVHVLLQAEYHWKRFSFGLRYTRDIQPFIKYTHPDGNIDTRKNQTLQMMVRFRVWEKAL